MSAVFVVWRRNAIDNKVCGTPESWSFPNDSGAACTARALLSVYARLYQAGDAGGGRDDDADDEMSHEMTHTH